MLVYTVRFKNLDKQEVERTLYFDLDEVDAAKLEARHKQHGGFAKWMEGLQKSDDLSQFFNAIEELFIMAYGERDPEDPDVFVKSNEISEKFRNNLALRAFIRELLNDPLKVPALVAEVLPEGFVTTADIDESVKEMQEQLEAAKAEAAQSQNG